MRITANTIRYAWLVIILGFFSFPQNVRAGSDPLTQADIEIIMAVRGTADALRDEALTQLAKSMAGKDEASFDQVTSQVQRIGQEADETACRQHGVRADEYSQKLRRIINVSDFVELESLKGEMQAEFKKRQSLSEEDLRAEAEQQYAVAEEWFRGIKDRTESDATANTEKPAIPDGYADSLQTAVMEPIRQQVDSGEYVEVVRHANENRIKEIRRQLRKIVKQMATPSMRQANADRPAVLGVLDQKTIQGLHSSVMDDVPAIPAK